mgnify:CR=1 FL=1
MAAINTNYLALVSQNNLQKSQSALGAAVDRLSSGLRLNRAQDDSAGLAIPQRLMEQVRGISPVAGDANNAISLTQVAEGSLGQVSDTLQRMRDLAKQSANGSNSDADRQSLQQEFGKLSDEIDRIAKETQYNGQNLLDGSFTGATFQVGGNNISIGAIADTQTSALGRVTSATATAENRQGVAGLDITTEAGALEARDRIDAAITSVVDSRSRLGASTNRIQVSISNLNNSSTNLGTANSRIRDADVAEESSNLTSLMMRSQAGAAILAQSNAMPQSVLSLLW